MTLLSHLLLLFLMALTVLSEKTRARGKGIIQSREKIVVTGVTEAPPAEHLLCCLLCHLGGVSGRTWTLMNTRRLECDNC